MAQAEIKGKQVDEATLDISSSPHGLDGTLHFTKDSINIQDLGNVFTSMTPSDGQALIFDTTNGWQAETLAYTADHTTLTNIGTNTHAQIDTHIADDTKHRLINDAGTLTTELFSASKIIADLATKEDTANKGAVNGYASLDGSGLVPTAQLPSYVDDVLEYANLAAFPVTGETGKIYVALDTNKTYRWSGSVYVYITSGAVDSVAGKTGIVTLDTSDIATGTFVDARISASSVTQHYVGDGTGSIVLGTGADANETDNIAIGTSAIAGQTGGGIVEINAIAIGKDAKAYETSTIAVGQNASAGTNGGTARPDCIAIGTNATSNGSQSISIGYGAVTSASSQVAIGVNATANNTSALALGASSSAQGVNAISIGDSQAREYDGIAIGALAQTGQTNAASTERYAIAIGNSAKSYEDRGIAIGASAIAGVNGTSGDPRAIAIGGDTQATGANSVAIGQSVVNATDDTVEIGSSNTNKMVMDASGNFSVPGTIDGRDVAADGTRLDTMEDNADVTDAINVEAAGAVMESDTVTTSMSFVVDEDDMVSNLATKVPTQQSVKAYVDNNVSSGVRYRSGYDAATNTPDLDTSPSGILIGDMYTVTAAGNFFTIAVEVGDVLISEKDNPTLEADWTIVNKNLDAATTSVAGVVELATQTEVDTGTDTTRVVTPATLAGRVVLTEETTNNNIYGGAGAGAAFSTGTENLVLGKNSGALMNLAIDNVGLGSDTLKAATSAYQNIAIGTGALQAIVDSHQNVAIGKHTGRVLSGSSANRNVFIGSLSALNVSSNSAENVFLGYQSAWNLNGTSAGNIFIGHNVSPSTAQAISNELWIHNDSTDTPLIHGDFSTGTLTINGDVGIGDAPLAWLDVSKDNGNTGNQFRVYDEEGATAAIRTYSISDPAGTLINSYYAVAGSPYLRYSDFVANNATAVGTTMRFITKNAANTYTTGLTLDDSGDATFAGNITVLVPNGGAEFILGEAVDTARAMRFQKEDETEAYDLNFYWSDHATANAGDLAFWSSKADERARLTSTGELLIGHDARRTLSQGIIPRLQVIGDTASTASLGIANYGVGSTPSRLLFSKSRSTDNGDTPAIVSNGDGIGYIEAGADDGTDTNTIAGAIRFQVNGTVAANQIPGSIGFYTADSAGILQTALHINSEQATTFYGTARLLNNSTLAWLNAASSAYKSVLILNSSDQTVLTSPTNLYLQSNDGVTAVTINTGQDVITAQNLAIGNTSLKAWNSSYNAFQLSNTGGIFASGGVGSGLYIAQNSYFDGSWKYSVADEAARYYQANGTHVFSVASAGALADDLITWATALTLNNDASATFAGDVLISSTTALLTLNDTNNGTGGTFYNPLIKFEANGTEVGRIGYDGATANLDIITYNYNSSGIRLYSAGSLAVTIDSSQNIGIGVSTLENWDSSYTALEIGGNASLMAWTAAGTGGVIYVNQNAYWDGAWKYQDTDEASHYTQNAGKHIFRVAPAASIIAATALVASTEYRIEVVGTTDFTLIGAASNTVGVVFTASGAGTGTGTASATAIAWTTALTINNDASATFADDINATGGVITNISSDITIAGTGAGEAGLRFDGDNNQILPSTTTASTDNVTRLGAATNQFAEFYSVDAIFSDSVGIGVASPTRTEHGLVDPKLHVYSTGTTGNYDLVARFEAGTDTDDTGASILINADNDRGLLIEGGTATGNVAIAHLGIVNNLGVNTRILTLNQDTSSNFDGSVQADKFILADSEPLELGNSTDATLLFDGSNTILETAGSFQIKTNGSTTTHAFNYNETGSEIQIMKSDGSQGMLLDILGASSNKSRWLHVSSTGDMDVGFGSTGTGVLNFKYAGGATGITLDSSGDVTYTGQIIVNDTTESTSTTTGSIQTDGGLGVVKDARIGGDLYIDGYPVKGVVRIVGQDSTVAGSTTSVRALNSTPVSTDGVVSCTLTDYNKKFAGSKLKIEWKTYVSGGNTRPGAILVSGSTVYDWGVTNLVDGGSTANMDQITGICHISGLAAGNHTFTIRVFNRIAGTVYYNRAQAGTTYNFGGNTRSNITITEYFE